MPDRIPVRAVRNGGLDFIEVPTAEETWIAAYQQERQAYLDRGDAESAALVAAELVRLGAPIESPTTTRKRSKA
jgi:FixJ family two-component response regulator